MELLPKEITSDIETNKNVASFDYYTGIKYAKEKGLIQNKIVNNSLFNKEGFCVCCGDVMCEIEPTDFPTIERRLI